MAATWTAAAPLPLRVPERRAVTLPSLATFLVCGWAFLLPLQATSGSGVRFAPSDVLIAAYALLALPRARRGKRAWTGWHGAVVAVVWTALAVALLRTGHVARSAVIDKAVGIVVLAMTFACVVSYATSVDKLRSVLRWFLHGAVANAVLSLSALALALGTGIAVPLVNEPFRTSRLSGLLIDPNAFGGLLATALLVHLVTTCGDDPLLSGWWSRIASTLLPLGLVLTFSRSAWIGAVLGVLAVACVNLRVFERVAGRLVGLLLVALPIVVVGLPNAAQLADRSSQVAARVSIGTSALADVKSDPLSGIGLGVYEGKHGVIVHNTTLWFLTEMGLVGLVVFGGLMVVQVRRIGWVITHGPHDLWVVGASLMAALFVGLGLSVGIEAFYQRYWWLVFSCVGAAHFLAQSHTKRELE